MNEPETVSCAPCEQCNGTGQLQLAPKPPALPDGDEGRCCSGCKQRFPKWSYVGHSTYNLYGGTEWWCSPGCYVTGTGDTSWEQRRGRPETRLTLITL